MATTPFITSVQADKKIQDSYSTLEQQIDIANAGSDLGLLKVTDTPPPTGKHRGDVQTAGTYTNFGGIVFTQPELDDNYGYIYIDEGVSSKVLSKKNNGKNAYQSYLDTTTDSPAMTEAEWVENIKSLPINVFTAFVDLKKDKELTISYDNFYPYLNVKPIYVQVYVDGNLQKVEINYKKVIGGYNLTLKSEKSIDGAEVNVMATSIDKFKNILKDGKTAAWYDRSNINGVELDENGRDSIYYDLSVGKNTWGEEQSSGLILVYGVYKIISTTTDFFFAGCKAGDIFINDNNKTASVSNRVVRMLGNHLTQFDETKRPINGLFDGINDFMKTAIDDTAFIQPNSIYMVFAQKSLTLFRNVFGGFDTSVLMSQANPTNSLSFYASSATEGKTNDFPLDKLDILRVVSDSEDSSVQANRHLKSVGDFGTANMRAFTLGAQGDGQLPSNIQFESAIIRKNADDNQIQTTIYQKLEEEFDIWGGQIIAVGYPETKKFLPLETYDGSGESVHPSVIDIGYIWNGFRYWMANTPYPGSNPKKENPSIWASNDGIEWVIPYRVTNPIIPEIIGDGFNADTDLFFENGILYMIFKEMKTESVIKICSTVNGYEWSEPTTIMSTLPDEQETVSPAIIKIDGLYFMYYYKFQGLSYQNLAVRRRSSATIDGIYSNMEEVSVWRGSKIPWHLDVIKIGDYFWLTHVLTNGSEPGTTIYVQRSIDGINFIPAKNPTVMVSSEPYEANGYYRPTLTLVDGDPVIYYATYSNANKWGLARINVDLKTLK